MTLYRLILTVSATTTRRSTATMVARQRMLPASAMVRLRNDIPTPIARFIALEVVELLRSASRQRPMIPIVRVKPVVDMTMETSRPMEPRPSAEEHPAGKPIRPIVAIRCAIIRRIVKVPVRTSWLNADPDRNL